MGIRDERQDKSTPWGFVVFTDSFMSGWGMAPGRSLYALAVRDHKEAETVLRNGKRRTDMKRGRIVSTLRNVRVRRGDDLKIVDKAEASRWYEPDGFDETKTVHGTDETAHYCGE